MGGTNISNIKLIKSMDSITNFVIVSGRSTLHLRQMADMVLKGVKGRNLTQAPSFKTGVEGDKDDGNIL
jgi:hypothetical protein